MAHGPLVFYLSFFFFQEVYSQVSRAEEIRLKHRTMQILWLRVLLSLMSFTNVSLFALLN